VRARFACAAACTAAALFAAAGPAAADNGPHVTGASSTTDSCAACHRAHTAQAPDLLKEAETTLCYSCHGPTGSGAATDVVDGVGYSSEGRGGAPRALRGGGFSKAMIDSAHASGQQGGKSNPDGVVPVLANPASVNSTHSVDGTEHTAWGNGPISATPEYGKGISLSCGSCHDPHGNGNYRILRPIPAESGAASGVAIPDATTKDYTTVNYWQVEDPTAPGFIAKVAEWCATCHTRYLSSTSYAATGDAVFSNQHRTDMGAQGSPNCIQCHVAHGSNAAAGEASSSGMHSLAGVPAAADGYLLRIDNRGVCQMCHLGE